MRVDALSYMVDPFYPKVLLNAALLKVHPVDMDIELNVPFASAPFRTWNL